MNVFVPVGTLDYSNGIFVVMGAVGEYFGLSAGLVSRVVGVILLAATLGSLLMWTSTPVKIFFSVIVFLSPSAAGDRRRRAGRHR